MDKGYPGVITRFLRGDERLMQSDATTLPLVIEAEAAKDTTFLQTFLKENSQQITHDIAKYGAVLLRGFNIKTDQDFENTVLSIKGMNGISDALMSEHGRTHVDDLKYVLHTNSVYKTGGTLYLGGFHSENYYNPDVPTYISFCCLKPSDLGGETGLVNMEKVYEYLSPELKSKLESKSYYVCKWLVSEVAERYNVTEDTVKAICQQFDLPFVGEGAEQFILMYKPSVFMHPQTNNKSLAINLFELPTLNDAMRKHFINDYQGKTWFWHRFFWRLPTAVFSVLEHVSVALIAFFHSPSEALKILKTKIETYQAEKKKVNISNYNTTKVGSCFNEAEVQQLATLIRRFYSSCLWQQGDIILVDNRKVSHAGMPGAGARTIRAMICNPLALQYSFIGNGVFDCKTREGETVGCYMAEAAEAEVPEIA